ELSQDKTYIDNVMKTNAERAYYAANKTLRKVKKKVGLTDLH
ncbi:MAG TPA: tryptophan--tRNA ligase, partial [Lachnospiraceae bacterium]|nr:tryptophan--tRNA ligase [Lachnospiraceae bacterium]